ncbi:O-antigen ligase family protein [Bacteroides heparinolyticus]|uniref:O-antigen ligase family protein n=1 Tax=Prevotella heparinolytica TaxID=28113 RepID=UPI0035A1A1FD
MLTSNRDIPIGTISSAVVATGLFAIAYYCMRGQAIGAFAVAGIPLAALWFSVSVRYPIISLFTYGATACFWGAIARRLERFTNISALLEVTLIYFFACMLFHALTTRDFQWKRAFNPLTVGFFVWFVYCFIELVNPSALTEAWINSRSFYPNMVLLAIFCSVLFTKYNYLKYLINGLAIFVILTFIKMMIQKELGFDEYEIRWLMAGSYRTHLLSSGTRYFSTFSDAGNFGSNMGGFGLMYAILAIYTGSKKFKLFYSFVSALAIVGMFMSGTRGAMIVPLGGMILFTIIAKNIKMTAIVGACAIVIYLFFAHTYIGEGNQYVRRMRTAFKPSEDASLNVRLENQKLIAEYLKDKPFGEGMGLAGVESRKYGERYITEIPVDSYYVKIWVQTGIVGILLHVGIFVLLILWGCYVIMFRVKTAKIRYILSAMICSLFGLMLSAYGNQFFGQPNTQFLLFTFMACILNGSYIECDFLESRQKKQSVKTLKTISV